MIKIESVNYKIIGSVAVFIGLLSYGLSPIIPFINGICVFSAIAMLILSYYLIIRPYIASQKDELNTTKQNDMEEIASIMSEMDEVIKEYETMLSEQVVQLPCNCGNPLFEGILIPNAENICVCPSCNDKFKVMVSYDSILITDSLDSSDIYDNIVKLEKEIINKTLD